MDVTAAHLGVSRQEFLDHLAAAQLVPEDVLARLAADASSDVMTLAESLLTGGLLTPFQLDALTAGRPDDLRVGNYDILSRLGSGGMGTVFKARHRRMKRVVAIKVLSADLSTDAAFVQRFQREVETVARLGHPNVVMAYDADESDIGHFLVMEYVSGRDLASAVEKSGTVDLVRAVDFTLQAARGLAYAHSQGIVHRDVKPHNLLLDDAGTVKVTDLGLARLNSAATGGKSKLTQAGGILGTVDYMPPEQAVDSAATDGRADIYSLGCTLYFLLAGTPPYSGQSLMSVLLKHRDAAIPSLRGVRPDTPQELEAVHQRMMAKAVEERFQSMTEVVAALEHCAAALGVQPVTAPSPFPKPAAASATDGSMSVLIVEPSRVQAGIIRRYLEAHGVSVTGAVTTGADAASAVRLGLPTGVVSSLHLADMSGIDLARQIRTEMPGAPPGFVLISSESETGEAGTLSQLHRVVMLAKPFTDVQLLQSLNLVTGRSVTVKASVTVAGLTGLTLGTGSGVVAKGKVERAAARVLVVDDSSTARVHQRGILTGLGFRHFTDAADGAQAIAAATREPFDLIVTDYNMPLMDGRALVSYLKQTPATAHVPLVMVTTETDPSVLEPVRQLGVTAIFEKAFHPAAVKPVMDRLFGA